ncbi:MAG: imidazolonepropionase-like amidohydrolase [Cognaticolwellia sp.]|jgi:imidazolonepropionase-like amidohydrolase
MLLLILACTRSVPDDKVQDSPKDTASDTADSQPNDTGETGEVDWPSEGLVLDHVTVFDAMAHAADRAVVLSGGEIWGVVDAGQDWPETLVVRDLTGHTVIPGLIDSHVHLSYSGAPWWAGDTVGQNLSATLRWGVTAVVDLGGPQWSLSLRDRVNTGELVGPRILASGPFLTAQGSHPCEVSLDPLCIFVDGDGAALAQAQMDRGSDLIKVALADEGIDMTWPRLSPTDLADIAGVALTVVHVASPQDWADAQAAGAVDLAHTPFSDSLTPEQAGLVISSVSSTVAANEGLIRVVDGGLSEAEWATVPEKVAESWKLVQGQPSLVSAGWPAAARIWSQQTRENLAILHAAEAPILAGSDAGYYFVPHGSALHWELEALVQAGMSEQEALAAASWLPAQVWGWEDLGLVAAGYSADLVILSADPYLDIANTRSIVEVLVAGQTPLEQTWQQEGGTFCLDDRDCSAESACDAIDHVCLDACQIPWAISGQCDDESWCRPQDGFFDDAEGVCTAEADCDLIGQDCDAFYNQACIPRDIDSNACLEAGPKVPGQSCDWNNPALRCEAGSYCSTVSNVCLEICELDAADTCGIGQCRTQFAGGKAWFGLCY